MDTISIGLDSDTEQPVCNQGQRGYTRLGKFCAQMRPMYGFYA